MPDSPGPAPSTASSAPARAAPPTPGRQLLQQVADAIHRRIVGQDEMVEGLLVGLLTGGHLLLEGLPGLAKTLLVRSLADSLGTTFSRIQFTPDLLPGDILGTPVFHQGTGDFRVHKGPIFANIVLADEVNRAPPKVQSALLEAMEEEQVTIDGTGYPLPNPFMVLATQNPIEQQGTYPLAEAQLDRFLMKLRIGYPARDEEKEILRRVALGMDGRPPDGGPQDAPDPTATTSTTATTATSTTPATTIATTTMDEILDARAELDSVRVDTRIQDYILDLAFATREPAAAGIPEVATQIEFGISPRASILMTRAARAHAFLRGRDFVLPDDVKSVAPAVLRHRLRTTYEADAAGIDSDRIVERLLDTVRAP